MSDLSSVLCYKCKKQIDYVRLDLGLSSCRECNTEKVGDNLSEKYRRDLAVRLCESETKLLNTQKELAEVKKAFKRYADHEADCAVEYGGDEVGTCSCFYLKKYYEIFGKE